MPIPYQHNSTPETASNRPLFKGTNAVIPPADPNARADAIQLASGAMLSLRTPAITQVEIPTIAHALANICRFTGHTQWHYSVAQHSVGVMLQVMRDQEAFLVAQHKSWINAGGKPRTRHGPRHHGRDLLKAALLHDAHEAFMGDWSTPLKKTLATDPRVASALADVEFRLREAVCTWFDLPAIYRDPHYHGPEDCIKHADLMLLNWERRDVLCNPNQPIPAWGVELPEPPRMRIERWTPTKACEQFLASWIVADQWDPSDHGWA